MYPPYYKDVVITYQLPGKEIMEATAWLAVNDSLECIWTISDTNIIISDAYVLEWRAI